MAKHLSVGSAAWTSGEEYGDKYSDRITQYINKANNQRLATFRVNHTWLRGLEWLHEHDEAHVAQIYLQDGDVSRREKSPEDPE
jgi:hypothetical protein